MQLQGHEDGHFSLDQEAYVDELVRSYGMNEASKSKIVCPKELLMTEEEGPKPYEESTVKLAQKLAGECLWLSQRTRPDVSFATAVLCSRVSKDPHSAIAIGKRILAYLFATKDYKLHLKPDPEAPILRVFTDASFSPQGQHSYGGHVVEVSGVPVIWKASRQSLVALSSSEAELIQAVEGCVYAESLLTVLRDLGVKCQAAELMLDNTAAISFIGGAGSQRTRHLKVRGFKIRQLIQSGWTVTHCRGEIQKADLLTKVLSAARTRFLCELLQLGAEFVGPEPEQSAGPTAVRSLAGTPTACFQGLMLLLQASRCLGSTEASEEGGVPIEWPWELGLATLLVVLSTLFLWEASGAPCRRRAEVEPRVRAVNAHKKDRRSRKLREQVAAAIDSAVSESPTADESRTQGRKSRNKCTAEFSAERHQPDLPQPTVIYGGVSMHLQHPCASEAVGRASTQQGSPGPGQAQVFSAGSPNPCGTQDLSRGPTSAQLHGSGVARGSQEVFNPVRRPRPSSAGTRTQASQTDPVIVLDPSEYVYISGGGECVHRDQNCRGLRRAGIVKPKAVCQYCLKTSNI